MARNEINRRQAIIEGAALVGGVGLTLAGAVKNIHEYATFGDKVEKKFPQASIKYKQRGRAKAVEVDVPKVLSHDERRRISQGIDELGQEAMRKQKINLGVIATGIAVTIGSTFLNRRNVKKSTPR